MEMKDLSELELSYKEFQHHFEAEFGLPTKTTKGTEGFSSHEWCSNGDADKKVS